MVAVNGVEMNYESVGEGRPILFIHGIGTDLNSLKIPMEKLFRKDSKFERIYVDLPGMGGTNDRGLIHDAEDILDTLVGFVNKVVQGDFYIMGHSYGGYLARAILKKMPDRVKGLFLLCPLVKEESDLDSQHIVIEKDDFVETIPEPAKTIFKRYAVLQTQRVWTRFSGDVLSGILKANRKLLVELAGEKKFLPYDPDETDSPFEGPVLILTGKQDSQVGYKSAGRLAEIYPHSTYVCMDRAGHPLQIEQPDVFEFHATKWLNEIDNLVSI